MLIHITKMVAMIVVKIPFFKVKACAESLFLETPRRPPFMVNNHYPPIMSFLLCCNVWRRTTIKFKLLKHFYQVMHSLQLSLNLEWGYRKECNMNLSTRIKKLKLKYSQLMQFQNINLSFWSFSLSQKKFSTTDLWICLTTFSEPPM